MNGYAMSDLVTYLISQIESELYEMKPDSEAIGEEVAMVFTSDGTVNGAFGTFPGIATEPITLSGQDHALVRKLVETGWVAAIMDTTGLDETLIVPEYASALLEVFHSIVEPGQKRYNAYVYSIY